MEQGTYITPTMRLHMKKKEAWAPGKREIASISSPNRPFNKDPLSHSRIFLNCSFDCFRCSKLPSEAKTAGNVRAHTCAHSPLASFEGSPNTCCSCGRRGRLASDQKPVWSVLKATWRLQTCALQRPGLIWSALTAQSQEAELTLLHYSFSLETNTRCYFWSVNLHFTSSLILGSNALFLFFFF